MNSRAPELHRYGDHPSQEVEIWRPVSKATHVVALLHGGWWRQRLDRSLMHALAGDLAGRGYLVWNIEFRRIDADGAEGGWPATLQDVKTALRSLTRAYGIAADQVTAVGHSAGGHLALLATQECNLAAAVGLAPITDLPSCAEAGLGEGATPIFIGGLPHENPGAYREASPLLRLPLGHPQLIVHGTKDDRVPVEHSRAYVESAQDAGDDVDLIEVAGADHMFVLDPAHPYWRQAITWIGLPRRS